MLDWAEDVVGFSGGGAYADTVAYAVPDRLDYVYDLGGWAPVAAVPELQSTLAPLDRFFLKRATAALAGGRGGGLAFRLPFSLIGLAARRLGDRAFLPVLGSSMADDDRDLLFGSADMAAAFRAIVRDGFAPGSRGPADDALRCYGDWGFDLSAMDYPVRLWHGTADKFASFRFAEYKEGFIPGATLRSFEGRGHLHMITLYDELFADVKLSDG